ncbi:MAG: DUF3781 domain-containing protein [Candidatus Absconditabacteria bacterium]
MIKANIIKNLCYTELVYYRVNNKLNLNLTKDEVEEFISTLIAEIPEQEIVKTGKNYYLVNHRKNVRLTINSNNYRLITVDKIN